MEYHNFKNINKLPRLPNYILVFGSNTEGRHGLGCAKIAKEKWGAIYGQSVGLQGQAYAIITKDLTKITQPSISKEYTRAQIIDLYICKQ